MSYLQQVIDAGDDLRGPAPEARFDQFERDEQQLDDALEAALRDEPGLGLEAAALLGRFWFSRGRLEKGRRWTDRFLEATDGQAIPARALALCQSSDLAFRQSDNDVAKRRANEALALARSLNREDIAATALTNLARTSLRDRDPESVRRFAGEARSIATKIQDEAKELQGIHCLAEAERMAGRLDIARALYTESLERNRKRGAKVMVAVELSNFGYVEKASGRLDAAEKSVREAIEVARSIGNKYIQAHADVALASILAAAGRADEASRLLGEADRMLTETGLTLDPADKPEYDSAIQTARAALGDAVFERLRAGT